MKAYFLELMVADVARVGRASPLPPSALKKDPRDCVSHSNNSMLPMGRVQAQRLEVVTDWGQVIMYQAAS